MCIYIYTMCMNPACKDRGMDIAIDIGIDMSVHIYLDMYTHGMT